MRAFSRANTLKGLITINIKTSASLLACDLADISGELAHCKNAGVDWIHFDVMDGVFVRQISFGEPVLKSVRQATDMFLDVHLMVENPLPQIPLFAEAGADLIDIHLESACDAAAALKEIRALGKKSALALKPDTSAEQVFDLLPLCDMVLIMTVQPGYGAQKLIPKTVDKIKALRKFANDNGFSNLEIEVDGGINSETAKTVRNAGATVLVSGTALFKAPDMAAADKTLKGI